jgi:hypothetical protein
MDCFQFAIGRRKFVLFFLKSEVVFASTIDTFRRLFARDHPSDDCPNQRLKGDFFACAPPATVQEALEAAARKRGLTPPVSWRSLVAARHNKHLRIYENIAYQELVDSLGSDGVFVSREELAGCSGVLEPRLMDLSQNPEKRCRMSPRLKTLLTQTFVWSQNLERPLLGEEHLAAQGVALFDHCDPSGMFLCPYRDSLRRVRPQATSIRRSVVTCADRKLDFGLLETRGPTRTSWHSPPPD